MLRRTVSNLGSASRLSLMARWLATSEADEIKRSGEMFSPSAFKPPTEVFGTPGRYATACWSTAAKENKLEKIEGELADIKKVFEEKPDFLHSLADPTELKHKKIKNVQDIFTEVGVDRILRNLFVIMAENGRLAMIPKVIAAYGKLMSAYRKETIVHVTTAQELTKKEVDQLLTSLKKRIGEDRNLSLQMKVEPEIVGGLIVEWDDAYRLDLSVATSIKKLEAELMSAI